LSFYTTDTYLRRPSREGVRALRLVALMLVLPRIRLSVSHRSRYRRRSLLTLRTCCSLLLHRADRARVLHAAALPAP